MAGSAEAPISVIVLAKDEEDRIEACLRSAAWAAERIVVVDDATRDATSERARPLATELIQRPWDGFVAAKRFAIERAAHDWICWLDADERVDADLAAAIAQAVEEPRGKAGFWMRRRSRYLGREIRHGNWGRDRVLRLFDRRRAAFGERSVHEQLQVEGATGLLPGILWHESYRDIAHHFGKIGAWSHLWAEQAHAEGRRASALDLLLRPPLRFVKGYVIRGGFLDGRPGLVVAVMDALYVGMKYTALLENEKRGGVQRRKIATRGRKTPEDS